MQRSCSSENI